MAPEGEPAQAQREASPQCAGHRAVRDLCVSAPVDRVALAAGPGAPSIDGAIAGYLFGNVGDRLVVAQGVEVMFEEVACPLMVDARQGSRLTEVRREGADPHPEQLRQLLLVPAYGLGVAEIYYRIIDRRFAVGAQDDVAFAGSYFMQFVFWVEVRQLPEAHAEAVSFEVGEHLLRVFEARVGELEVAAVGNLGPAGVDVDHVRRDALLAQLLGDPADFFF